MLDSRLPSLGLVGSCSSSSVYLLWLMSSRSRPVDFELCDRYMQNSLVVESPEMEAVRTCARKHKITVALGFSENFHHSLYISQCTIGSTGEILMHRRKILPTHMERTIFGNASGSSLKNVVATDVGQVSQLACWEHTQPLLKYHTITQRAAFHVASWPPVPPCKSKDELWSMSREGQSVICPLKSTFTDFDRCPQLGSHVCN